MKKIWIACDSFKGSCSSHDIAEILADETHRCFPEIETHYLSISDGGEGLIESVMTLPGFEKVMCQSVNPWLKPIQASYAQNKTVAIIEMAQCSGLSLCQPLNPSLTSTYGTGLQIKDAISQGCRTIYIGLGGSGTHDGATGICQALGARFYNQQNQIFLPTGATLSQITHIDVTALQQTIQGCQFYLLSDVRNPACGKMGAAEVFAKQKGADRTMIDLLEANTLHYCQILVDTISIDYREVQGAGAAGACGVGLLSLLHAQGYCGLDQLLQWANFESSVEDASLLVTGEGRIDNQSLNGKVIVGILEVGLRHHIPVLAICGQLALPTSACQKRGFYDVLIINPETMALEECLLQVKTNLRLSWHIWLLQHGPTLFKNEAN